MPKYEYKTVPAPMVLSIKNESEERAAIARFSEIMNAEAHSGWEFYSMETITTKEAQGCFSSGKGTVKHHNMLVFRRETDV